MKVTKKARRTLLSLGMLPKKKITLKTLADIKAK